MHVADYLGLLRAGEAELADALDAVASHHGAEPDITAACTKLAEWSRGHVEALAPLAERYGAQPADEPHSLRTALFRGPREGGFGLVRDLHDLWLMATETQLCWTILSQAAAALRDAEMKDVCDRCGQESGRQIAWLRTRVKLAAPQALVVA